MLSVGTRLGNFEIVAPLRSGGMAALYLARRRGAAGFDRPVAIKVIHSHLASDQDFVAMFLDEARLATRIQDPHVVHVEELGEDQGQYFIVMEFVQGRSLHDLLKALGSNGRRMHPACAIHIAIHVARGLQAAHEAKGTDGKLLGVVHRDVSPQNVLISFRGNVKLIDFGIAKARGQSHHTVGDSLRGKIAYMSPEQAFGRDIDSRADVYALGVVLWEMLTSSRLFSADNELALLDRVRAPQIKPPSSIVPQLSSALDEVVLAALDPDPARRIPTARELARRLSTTPEAAAIDPSDLAGLMEAVVPDTPDAPWHVTDLELAVTELRPSPGSSQAALDTLSIISDETPAKSTGTGATVVALEEARDALAKWRRRSLGVSVAAAIAIAVVIGFVVIAPARRAAVDPPQPTTPVPTSSLTAPTESSTAAVDPAAAPAPTASSGSTHAALAQQTPKKGKPPIRRTAPSGSVAHTPRDAHSIEIIDRVPMIRDPNL